MSKRASPTDVIDLTEEDDDDIVNIALRSLRRRLSSIPATVASALRPSPKRVKRERTRRRDLLNRLYTAGDSDSDIEEDGTRDRKPAAKTTAAMDHEEESDVEVLEAPAPRNVPTTATATARNRDSDEIEVVGTVNQVLLPHMRQHCTEKPFLTTVSAAPGRCLTNMKVCSLCYCYVCDVEASKCPTWAQHCFATDSGPGATLWKAKRNAHRQKRTQAVDREVPTPTPTPAATGGHQSFAGAGPFPPDTAGASAPNKLLTKCRKCGWFNKYAHQDFMFDRDVAKGIRMERTVPRWYNSRNYEHSGDEIHPTGFLDWCHACGCVASERDLRKAQSQAYIPSQYSIFLGTKTIDFRLKAHDPREMEKYSKKWAQEEWTYDESEMEQELFEHRLGKFPVLEMIVASIPITTEDKIPSDGRHQDVGSRGKAKASVSETEAVLIDNHGDSLILKELFKTAPTFGAAKAAERDAIRYGYIDGDIKAVWNSSTRKGKFTLRVFVNMEAPTYSKKEKGGKRRLLPPQPLTAPEYLTEFLGTWFGVFPFRLADISGLVRSDDISLDNIYGRSAMHEVPLPPFIIKKIGSRDCVDAASKKKKEMGKTQNKSVDQRASTYALASGTGCTVLGGLCTNETDFAGTLKRYFREIFADIVLDARSPNHDMVTNELGIVSCHRTLRRGEKWVVPAGCANYVPPPRYLPDIYASILSREEYPFAMTSMRKDAKRIYDKTRTLNGLMDHLENLGHAVAPFVEGLAVELLPFQSQTVQWATEREQTPGGVNAFLWTKLPSIAQPNKDLYFSPILGELTVTKPLLARGGIIAEQMGLGKTVISLALILRNPAPPLPVSGTAIASINVTPVISSGAAFWDPDLYSRTSASKEKRGRIISRGTLVVCNVSLVGQWITEAKSKLKDPGLIYSYHGTKRKRDAKALAANSIVVTTYETLASDATYHAKRSNDGAEYAAPCEQVRWWRIICDESHSIRNKGAKSAAVLELVADNKWLVSGTPVNTSLMDLDQQLEFIGIDKVGSLLRNLKKSTFRHISDQHAIHGNGGCPERRGAPVMPMLGSFTFLMRAVMMRHSQKQTYRDTSTTLMSLPPKTHRTILIDFSAADRAEYDTLETTARAYYQTLKDQRRGPISRHFLALTQKLMPLRIACAGGRVPLDDVPTEAKGNNDYDGKESEDAPKKRKPKKFSKFAFTSKLKTLVSELERLRTDDPSAKSLVFSQFTSTLQWLKEELPNHGFQFRTLSGDMSMTKRTKALADFQNDPPTTIFLLSMRAGAVGINLTQANRIFLMEPCFNPALEAQAIGRVHRLGQKRRVEIIRLLMKDSVDSRIVEMLEKKHGKMDGLQANDKADAVSQSDAGADDKGDSNKDGSDGDKKAAALDAAGEVAVQTIMVGSLYRDKATVVAEEFDLLYGVEPTDTVMQQEDEDRGDYLVLDEVHVDAENDWDHGGENDWI